MCPETIILEAEKSGLFEIRNDGTIWRTGERRSGKVRPCSPRRAENNTGCGYLQVRLMIDGKRYHVLAHRIVYTKFTGLIPDDHDINHLNGLKDDNRPENLQATTKSENARHAHRGGLVNQYGEKNPRARLTDREVAQVRLAYSKGSYTQKQLADRFGVSHQCVSKVIRGHRRQFQLGPIAQGDLRHCDHLERDDKGRFMGHHEREYPQPVEVSR